MLSGGYYNYGEFIPFIKDVGTDALNALSVTSHAMGDDTYKERVQNYRNMCARQDLSMAVAMTDPKGDRSKTPSHQAHPDYYLRVVDETKDAIVVRGAKVHITAAAYVDEIIVLPTRNMKKDDQDYAVSFAVKPNTKGVTQLCRPNFRYKDDAYFPTPHPRRGHIESMIVFDDVKIPKERVFLCREWQYSQALAHAFATFHRMTGATYKIPILEMYTGLGILAAEMNGIAKAAHVKEKIVSMITYTETLKTLSLAAVLSPEEVPGTGLYAPNKLMANMAKHHFAAKFHTFMSTVQDIAGGILVTLPTHKDYANSDIGQYMKHYLGGSPDYSSEDRMRLISILNHHFSSHYAGWHMSATLHGEGSLESQKMMIMSESPKAYYVERAKGLLGMES